MSSYSYVITDDYIAIYSEHLPECIIIPSSDNRYSKIARVIDDEVSVLSILKDEEDKLRVIANIMNVDIEEIPKSILDRIRTLIDLDLPVTYLVNFWKRLSKNPSKDSRESLFDFLQHHCIAIRHDGYIVAYKAVRPDMYDIYSKTIKYEIGKEVRIPREEVDPDRNIACSRGLHIGTIDYARSFGPIVLEVLVDPVDVVAVPFSEIGKCRVCALTPLRVLASKEDHRERLFDIDYRTLPDSFVVGRKIYKKTKPIEEKYLKVKPSKCPKALKSFANKYDIYRTANKTLYKIVDKDSGKTTYYELMEE